jgi:hypothetical protein
MLKHFGVFALLLNLVALGVLWYLIPHIGRPLDAWLIALFVLGIINAAVIKQAVGRTVMVLVASLSITFFVLEMAQEVTNFLNPFEKRPSTMRGVDSPYAWDTQDASSYVAARRKALADGLDPASLEGRHAGDIFAGMDPTALYHDRQAGGNQVTWLDALKDPCIQEPLLGVELTPDNRIRHYSKEEGTDETLFDAEYMVGEKGCRFTKSDEAAKDTVIFVGGSFTFGHGLNDDETLPFYFSEAGGFADRVLNFAVSGYGPNQVLRDLELNYKPGLANIDPTGVRAVVFLLIDDHANQAVKPASNTAPYYVLKNNRPAYQGPYFDPEGLGRLNTLLFSSRIIPILRERLGAGKNPFDVNYKWDLTAAMLREMNRICLERYGVPMTVAYWGDGPEVLLRLMNTELDFFQVREAFGEEFANRAIKFYLQDGHPSAYANRLLGKYMRERLLRDF